MIDTSLGLSLGISTLLYTLATQSAEPANALAVPPVKPWVKKAREQKEKQRTEPEVITILKTYTGQEPEGTRFDDIPRNRRLLNEHLAQLVVDLNHGTAQQTEKFLQLCAQKNVVINHDMSEELFKIAYENRQEREKNYVQSIESSKKLISDYREKQIKELTTKLEQCKKQTESWTTVLSDSCTQHKNGYETHTKVYTNIMQLAQKLNPHFAPTYATNPTLYYDDLEKQFVLTIKMEQQAALATHMREISKLLVAMKQFGNIDMEQVWFEKFLEHWSSESTTGGERLAINQARRAHSRMIFKAFQPAPQVTPSQAASSSESESAVEEAKRRIEERRMQEAGNLDTELQAEVVANLVQPNPSNSASSSSTTSKRERTPYDFSDVKGKVKLRGHLDSELPANVMANQVQPNPSNSVSSSSTTTEAFKSSRLVLPQQEIQKLLDVIKLTSKIAVPVQPSSTSANQSTKQKKQ